MSGTGGTADTLEVLPYMELVFTAASYWNLANRMFARVGDQMQMQHGKETILWHNRP